MYRCSFVFALTSLLLSAASDYQCRLSASYVNHIIRLDVFVYSLLKLPCVNKFTHCIYVHIHVWTWPPGSWLIVVV